MEADKVLAKVKELQPAIADLSKALIDRKTSWSVNCPSLVQDFLLIGGEAQLPLAVTNGVKLVKNHRFEIVEAAG
jgi:hypothetical protein